MSLASWWFNKIIKTGGLGELGIDYISFENQLVSYDDSVDTIKTVQDNVTSQSVSTTPKTLEWTHDKNGELSTPVDIRHATKPLEVFVTIITGTSTIGEVWATASPDTQTGTDTLLFTTSTAGTTSTPQKLILPAGKYLTMVRKSGSNSVSLITAITIERG